ncbi:T9SS type A sorting domain-containing protein [Flavobacterium cerinum]|uniref:T9SS type A sorting domain-containing protein n=1 Tax=Flavobacterium cerinum TaxID=2502784 RepID=A0ABY5ILS9_9FLAO|nr:T9SS type A sorting domain-containing protein [Flavobacterium cerinum]UUC43813.1 T9SS type A sorting domain-containing protein [Flavobacterium cerinum]
MTRTIHACLTALLWLAVTDSVAQPIRIGNETSNNITSNAPVNCVYEKSASESLYLSSEIDNSGTITALSWQHSSTFNASITNNIKIYLRTTTQTALPSGTVGTGFSGYTEVFSGSIPTIASAGWNTVTLTAPFTYDKNAGNLFILVVRDAATKDDNNYPRFRATTTNPNYLCRKYSSGVDFFTPTATPWSSNSAMSGDYYRPNIQITMNANTPTATYCTITNNNSCLYGGTITNVTFAGINNTTDCSQDNYSYIDYTGTVAAGQLTKGSTQTISVTVDNPGSSGGVGVWIDFNQNGTFESSEFFSLGTINSSNSATFSSNQITIPTTALAGTTRMRIRSKRLTAVTAAESCEFIGSARGEVEDYAITITQQPLTISDFDKPIVTLFPNPTQGNITFESINTIKKITLFNPIGQIIAVSNTNSADLTAFANGIYTARIEFEDGKTVSQKIIKK